jgi:hypothetical protein
MSRPPPPAIQPGSFPQEFAKARPSQKWGWLSVLPRLGLLLIILGCAFFVFTGATWWCLVVIVPCAPAILGGLLRKPLLQKVGVGFMALLSFGWLAVACFFYRDAIEHPHPFMLEGLSKSFGHLALGMSLFMGLSALLLSPRWWPVEDETSSASSRGSPH